MAKSIKIALELDTSQFDKGMKSAKRDLSGLNSELANGKSKSEGYKVSMTAVAGAVAAVGAAAMGLKSALDAAQSVENLNVTLTTLYGDAGLAAEAMETVKEQAAGLTFALSDIQSGVPALALVEEKFGGLDNAIEYTAGVASAFGMSFQEAATNVQRSMTAGIGSADLFRDKGVKAFLGFQEGVKYSTEETQAMMLGMFEEVTAANELAAQTLTGQFSMVEDAMFAVSEAIGTAFGETLKTELADLNTAFAENKEQILEVARTIGQVLGRALTLAANNADILLGIMAGMFAAAAVGRVVAVVTAIMNFTKAMQAAAVAGTILQGVTGVGLLKVAAGLTAAGASIAVMNGMFSEQEEVMGDINTVEDELEANRVKNAEAEKARAEERTGAQRAEEERIKAVAKAEEDKNAKREEADAKKAEKDAEQAAKEEERRAEKEKRAAERHQKEMLRAQEVLEQANNKFDTDLREINSTVEKIGLTETQIEQLNTTNELNAEREQKLDEIAKYNISDEEKNRLQEELNALYDAQIPKINEAIAAVDTQQRKFSTGWTNAWTQYKDDATNNAKTAGEMFDVVTGGMENAFVDFVATGKGSFKDLIDDMINQLKRIIAKKIFVNILNMLAPGMGSLFEGFFDAGGTIGRGKLGIVGERGPEIVRGPAQIVGRQQTASMMGGGGSQVTYNINAVDANSFKQLVAQDPEFIYNVTVAGSRRIPR